MSLFLDQIIYLCSFPSPSRSNETKMSASNHDTWVGGCYVNNKLEVKKMMNKMIRTTNNLISSFYLLNYNLAWCWTFCLIFPFIVYNLRDFTHYFLYTYLRLWKTNRSFNTTHLQNRNIWEIIYYLGPTHKNV